MEAVLFGVSKQRDTITAMTVLSDSKKVHRFVDLKSETSTLSEVIGKTVNSLKLPILADEGVIYLGIESILRHCRS